MIDTALTHKIKKLLQIPAVFFNCARFDCACRAVNPKLSAAKKLALRILPKQIALLNLPRPFEILGLYCRCSADFTVLIEIAIP